MADEEDRSHELPLLPGESAPGVRAPSSISPEVQEILRQGEARRLQYEANAGITSTADPSLAGQMPPEVTADDALASAEARIAEEEEAELNPSAGISERFFTSANVGIAKTLGMPVDVVNWALNLGGMGTEEPFLGSESIMSGMESMRQLAPGQREAHEGYVGSVGEVMGGGAAGMLGMIGPVVNAARTLGPQAAEKMVQGILGAPGVNRTQALSFLQKLKAAGLDIAETAINNPRMFIAGETAASVGAGTAMETAEQIGYGPEVQALAGIVGGVPSAIAPTMMRNMFQRAATWGMRNMLPMTPQGAQLRANAQAQARALDPEAAAQRALNAPEGTSAARATGEEGLMAMEARVLADDIEIRQQVTDDLTESIRRTSRELADAYRTPEGRADWELTVMERVAPTGADAITPGPVDDMLNQAYQAFEVPYGQIKGFPIRPHLFSDSGRRTTLRTMLDNVPDTQTVMAGPDARNKVDRWLSNAMDGLEARTIKSGSNEGLVYSEDLLRLRSQVRDQARAAGRRQDGTSQEFLNLAEDRITSVLHNQLSDDLLGQLRRTDAEYANFKTVEDAVFRSGEQGLTPNALLTSIRRSASSQGAHARGEGMEMRVLAQEGRRASELWNKPPEAATRVVRGMEEGPLRNLQNDYVNEIMRRSVNRELSDEGLEVLSGAKMLENLRNQGPTLRAMGMGDEEIGRLTNVAMEIGRAEARSPAAVERLYEDGPATIMQLLATIVGAQQGQRVASGGMGSSMVLAGFFSKRARERLMAITTDKAKEILVNAHRPGNEDLYAALLTGPTEAIAAQNSAARALGAYLAPVATTAAEAADTGIDELRNEVQALGLQ